MVVLCSGTGSVDKVFKLADFNVLTVDIDHSSKPDLVADIKAWSPEELYFGIRIKTSKVNDNTGDVDLTSNTLMRFSYLWKTHRVIIHNNKRLGT